MGSDRGDIGGKRGGGVGGGEGAHKNADREEVGGGGGIVARLRAGARIYILGIEKGENRERGRVPRRRKNVERERERKRERERERWE